jgi:hypothetical protein
MAALVTRADIVRHGDDYLTVLPRTGENKQRIEAGIAAVVAGEQPAQLLFEPPRRPGEEPRLLGYGYEEPRPLKASVDGERVEWQERVQVIRSVELARSQGAALETRLGKAEAALWVLPGMSARCSVLGARRDAGSARSRKKGRCSRPWRRCGSGIR